MFGQVVNLIGKEPLTFCCKGWHKNRATPEQRVRGKTMNKLLAPLLLIVVFFVGFLVTALSKSSADEEKKLDNLIVYGGGFMFSVKEPSGWTGDTTNAAKLHANILFYKKGEINQIPRAIIFVRVNEKSDECVEKDLEWDMEQYRKQCPKIQFKDISVSHPHYKTYSKLFFVKDSFYEYVTYINPGVGKPLTFSAAMNVPKVEATKDALAAYRQVIETLTFLGP